MNFDNYVLDYLPRVVRKVKAVSGSQQFNLLGWCLGALISTLYAALRPNDGLKDLILLTAPLDFSDQKAGGFSRWTSSGILQRGSHRRHLREHPRRNDRLRCQNAQTGRKLHRQLHQSLGPDRRSRVVEAWHAMNTWVREVIPMAGAAYRQLINDFYKENRLKEGTLELRGERVDLKNVKASILERDRRSRSYYAPVSVRGHHGSVWQHGQGDLSRAGRPHWNHGGQRR